MEPEAEKTHQIAGAKGAKGDLELRVNRGHKIYVISNELLSDVSSARVMPG